jgi:RNA polymerase primary sigma factor
MADDSETSIKVYLQEISGTPLLTMQEEIELAARIKNGDQKARAWMIKANLRLVVKIAHAYSNLGFVQNVSSEVASAGRRYRVRIKAKCS